MIQQEDLEISFFSDFDSDAQKKIKDEIYNHISSIHSEITTAHNPDLLEVLSRSFSYKSDMLIIRKKSIFEGFLPFCVTAGLGSKVVSIPHFSYGGYIGENKLTDQQYLECIELIKRKYNKNVLIREFRKITKSPLVDKVAYFLNLKSSSEEQFKNFSSKLRSQIRKAEKNGLTVEQSSIKEFYQVYLENMHRLGSPHLSEDFFTNLEENYSHGRVIVFSVKYDNEIVGASVLLIFSDFSEVTWAATKKDFNHLAPNMILYWKMIDYCISQKMKTFSFGRASKDTGSLRFKKQWGGEEIQLFWNYSFPQKSRIEDAKFLTSIWKYLPRFIIKIFGPIITKYVY
tara:strand:- start:2624 stop:3652 length:1029 start_codon:yes stop_codon:yes gene_type:complete